jgi:hypothetical protein
MDMSAGGAAYLSYTSSSIGDTTLKVGALVAGYVSFNGVSVVGPDVDVSFNQIYLGGYGHVELYIENGEMKWVHGAGMNDNEPAYFEIIIDGLSVDVQGSVQGISFDVDADADITGTGTLRFFFADNPDTEGRGITENFFIEGSF